MQSVRWRRLAAGLIDFAPFAIAFGLVTPILLTIGLIAHESHVGVGIFDPTVGGDPVVAEHLNGRLALTVLIGMLGCVAAQAVLLAQLRGTIGQIVCGILVQRQDGRPASLGRRLLRGSLRQAIALALLATAVVAASKAPASPVISAEALALLALALASALALVLVIDLVLALADGRAIGDRLAGTALRRRWG
jgi:uncharacterized RDD family membrane protein YckC